MGGPTAPSVPTMTIVTDRRPLETCRLTKQRVCGADCGGWSRQASTCEPPRCGRTGVRAAGGSRKVKYASAHDFRRTFGMRWATRMMPAKLMDFMRHESIETSLRFYVGIHALRPPRLVAPKSASPAGGRSISGLVSQLCPPTRQRATTAAASTRLPDDVQVGPPELWPHF